MRIKKLIFPERCPGCRKVLEIGRSGFCDRCIKTTRLSEEPACVCCGKPVENSLMHLCQDCVRLKHSFIQNRALYLYEGAAIQAMYNLKYNNDKWIAELLAGELYRRFGKWIKACGIEAFIPVPMYGKKERARGYNQAWEIAARLSDITAKQGKSGRIPVVAAVKRVRNTTPQKELSVSVRRKNVKKAFKLDRNVVELYNVYHRGRLTAFKSVLIVDDIFTTGATIDAVSDLCIAGGIASEVYSVTAVIGRGNV